MKGLRGSIDLRDITAVVGLGLLSGGVAVIYWPAALIVSGVILLGIALGGIGRNGNTGKTPGS